MISEKDSCREGLPVQHNFITSAYSGGQLEGMGGRFSQQNHNL